MRSRCIFSITSLVLFAVYPSGLAQNAGPAAAAGAFIPATTLPVGCQAPVNVIRRARLRGDRNTLNTTIKSVVRPENFEECFAQILTIELPRSVVRIAKQSANRQAGSPAGSGGSTSVVSQPLSPLSLASEYGGLTTSSNNGTFTVQGALDQVPGALASDHVIDICRPGAGQSHCVKEGDLDLLHRISVAATFNTSTSSKTVNAMTTGPLQGTTQQVRLTPHGSESPSLSSITAKAVLWHETADAASAWSKAVTSSKDVTTSAQDLASKISALANLPPTPQFSKWQQDTIAAISTASDSALESVFLQQFNQLHTVLINGGDKQCSADNPNSFACAINAVRGALGDYNQKMVSLREQEEKPVLTFEYDWSEPQNQPTNSVFKLILSKNVLDKAKQNTTWTLTANGAFSIYNSEPASTIPNASRLRDIQAGAEVDRILPKIPLLGQTTLSLAYYFQDQTSPSILKVTPSSPITGITFTNLPTDASEVFTQKGDIHLAQLKWALGTGKNVRFPFAFSYSNRTDLIQKPDWRGQFGVSYDFSSLLSGQSGSTGSSVSQ